MGWGGGEESIHSTLPNTLQFFSFNSEISLRISKTRLRLSLTRDSFSTNPSKRISNKGCDAKCMTARLKLGSYFVPASENLRNLLTTFPAPDSIIQDVSTKYVFPGDKNVERWCGDEDEEERMKTWFRAETLVLLVRAMCKLRPKQLNYAFPGFLFLRRNRRKWSRVSVNVNQAAV